MFLVQTLLMLMFTRLLFAVCRSVTWYDGCRYPDRVIAIQPVSRGTMDVPHPDKVSYETRVPWYDGCPHPAGVSYKARVPWYDGCPHPAGVSYKARVPWYDGCPHPAH